MKATGIVRQVDALGRIVLPIELRRTLDIEIKDSLEIFTDGDDIILRPYRPCCIFCGEGNDISDHMGKKVCRSCIEKLNNK